MIRIGSLVSSLLLIQGALGSCELQVGTPVQSVWVINEWSAPVVIRVDQAVSRWLAQPGSSVPTHGTTGRDERTVDVLTEDCALMSSATFDALLTVRVHADQRVEFSPGASQSQLVEIGDPAIETATCP